MKTIRMTDWESHLVSRAQIGEMVAFELLADLHRDSLHKLAMRYVRNHEDAADMVQETLVKAFRSLHSFVEGRPVLPWLSRICVNCCVDLIRQRRTPMESIEKFEYGLVSHLDVFEEANQNITDGHLRDCIHRLPNRYRDILLMRHVDQLELSEIAERIEKPEGTVKSLLFRGRNLLRRELERLGWNPNPAHSLA